MKTEVKERGFQPVKLEITIESEEELHELWHRMNITSKDAIEASTEIYPADKTKSLCFDLFDAIDDLIEST